MVINTPAWATTPADDNRLNRVTNISNIGTVLATLDKTKHGLLICTQDGSGLFKDHIYLCNAAGDALIDLSVMAEHDHSSTTTGGTFNRLFRNNSKHMDLSLTKIQDVDVANWDTSFTSGGTTEPKIDVTTRERSIRLRPNATSGGASSIRYPNMKIDFTQGSFYQVKLQLESTSSLALHTGVGADYVTAADSTNRKYQAEVCTTNNNNWWLRTANGSGHSASDIGIAISTSRVGIKIEHYPGDSMWLVIGGTWLEKTSHVPSDGGTGFSNLITHSIKNSTAADKPMLIYGTRLVYYIGDDWV